MQEKNPHQFVDQFLFIHFFSFITHMISLSIDRYIYIYIYIYIYMLLNITTKICWQVTVPFRLHSPGNYEHFLKFIYLSLHHQPSWLLISNPHDSLFWKLSDTVYMWSVISRFCENFTCPLKDLWIESIYYIWLFIYVGWNTYHLII
jgi:hypothetical protein